MIKFDEDSLMCDLAETYHIYDYKQLPIKKVAVFSFGLRDDSRIKLKLANQKVSNEVLMLAAINDQLSIANWMQTKDASKSRNKPDSILNRLIGVSDREKQEMVFESGKEFENARQQLMRNGGGQ